MKWPFKKESEPDSLENAIEFRSDDLWTDEGAVTDDEELIRIRKIAEIDEIKIRNLESLVEIEEKRKPTHWWNKINPNTVLMVIGNAALTVLIVKHEDLNVITSKAKQFWMNIKQ